VPEVLGRPKRPTSETLARILAGDDASPIAVESDKYDSVHDEQRDLLRKLKNIGVVQIPASVQTIEQLRCFYAERCKSGTVNGLVRHCPLCEETKHRDEFPRRKNTEWCKTCDKDPTLATRRQLIADELARQQREVDFDVRPAAHIERKQARKPQNTKRDEDERVAVHRAVDLFYDSLPSLRDQLRMAAGYAPRSAFAVPRFETNDVADPTGRHAVEECADTPTHTPDARNNPAAEVNALMRWGFKQMRNVIDLGRRVAHHVPDQPPAPEWNTCLECNKPIEDGNLRRLEGRPYCDRGGCYQKARRRARETR
jgi:hypothetical protein